MKGSALIMDFDSRKELDDYIANEPYVIEEVWEKIATHSATIVIKAMADQVCVMCSDGKNG